MATSVSLIVVSRCSAQENAIPAITISPLTTPGVAGFTTFFFNVIPGEGGAVTSAEGRFTAAVAGSMRQVYPFGLTTVLDDNNAAIIGVGEHPFADSQFEFSSSDVDFVLGASESSTELKAALVGLSPIVSQFTLAHVALANGVLGTWEIGLVQRDETGATFEYRFSGMFAGLSELPGDYNNNGTVDAADYVLWRHTFGQAGSGLAADGNANQQVDEGDYVVWSAHFGRTFDGGLQSAAVPEPATCAILVAAPLCMSRRRARDYCRTVYVRSSK